MSIKAEWPAGRPPSTLLLWLPLEKSLSFDVPGFHSFVGLLVSVGGKLAAESKLGASLLKLVNRPGTTLRNIKLQPSSSVTWNAVFRERPRTPLQKKKEENEKKQCEEIQSVSQSSSEVTGSQSSL